MLTIILTGPTCSGKGAAAHALARRIGGEIISLDSMKVYRRMDIGTAKPSAAARREVPYHLIDVVDPGEEYSLGRYVREALAVRESILARGGNAIFAGGTPLYLWGLARGFCPAPGADRAVRERLAERMAREGLGALHAELASVDPAAGARIHPNDRKRIERALEVYHLTGKPFTEFWRNSVLRLPPNEHRIVGLLWPRETLYRRIDERVTRMMQEGLLAEAEAVAARSGPLSRTALQCIGYREAWEGKARGEREDRIASRIRLRTRHFARRQLAWFRRFPEIHWVRAEDRSPEDIAGEIAGLLAGEGAHPAEGSPSLER